MLGELIGNYRVIRKLGEGGMGEVFLAEHENIGTLIAIKVLFEHISKELSHVDRFFNEARAVARIRHAGIVKITDVGFTPSNRAYLLMEFLEGESLGGRIARGRMAPAAACEIARQMASVLGATHAAGIIHRDLKPDNVYLVPDHELPGGERVKVLDFGIAKLTGDLARGRVTQSQSQMGTPVYMSPEQWGDASRVDGRTDIYSLGCIAFEMLTGRLPFEATSIMEAFALHTQTAAPSARDLVPEISPDLDALLARLMAKAPADRPQTMQEVSRAFADLAASAASGDRTGRSDAPPRVPTMLGNTPLAVAGSAAARTLQTRSRRRTYAAAALIVVGGGVTVSAVVLGGRGHRATTAALAAGATTAAGSSDARAAALPDGPIDPPRGPIDAGAPPALREQVEGANPFVIVGSPPFAAQRRLVSHEAYAWFVAAQPEADRAALRLLENVEGATPSAPVTWITHAQAEAFCHAIDADLPTSAQWAIYAGERTGPVTLGPVSEWTGPAADGVALVREPRDRAAEPDDPLYLGSEVTPGVKPEAVAGASVGFRCVR